MKTRSCSCALASVVVSTIRATAGTPLCFWFCSPTPNSRYTDENGADHPILSTQFEAVAARKAFPCWDEPRFKVSCFNVCAVRGIEIATCWNFLFGACKMSTESAYTQMMLYHATNYFMRHYSQPCNGQDVDALEECVIILVDQFA